MVMVTIIGYSIGCKLFCRRIGQITENLVMSQKAGCSGRGSGEKRDRHPGHLRGKAIGLWYAHKNKGKKPDKRVEKRSLVKLAAEDERKLLKLLSNDTTNRTSVTPSEKEAKPLYVSHYDRDPDPVLDKQLLKNQIKMSGDSGYTKMQEFREKLPTFPLKDELIHTIENNSVVVISGDTGCGKTTQIPQYILDHYIEMGKGSSCSIVCTQPRRISAIGVSERVAQERGEQCGKNSVGFQIRLESKLAREKGSILYCTTGVVLKWLESDRLLKRVTHVFLDEVHERSLHSDFLLIVLKDILKERPDLKVILMSATLNAEVFSNYFADCPQLHVPGLMYHVEPMFLEDILLKTKYQIESETDRRVMKRRAKRQSEKSFEREAKLKSYAKRLIKKYPVNVINSLKNFSDDEIDVDLVTAVIEHICRNKPTGAILVFLTGWNVIRRVHDSLKSLRFFNSDRFRLLPLHSMMPTASQRDIFETPPEGVWKIILATSIAETSITIDDVKYVVDCGKVKQSNFDLKANLMTLQEELETKANATQRRGRAGRVQEGICYHLFPKMYWDEMLDYQVPEMLRTRLEELCLQIKLMKLGDIATFLSQAIEPPSDEAVRLSIEFLKTLNALDENENLTPLGYHLARLPVDPQTGKMILFGAICSCLDPVTTVAASLSYKDAFVIPLGREHEVDRVKIELAGESRSDHVMLAYAMKGWEEAKRDRNGRNYCWDNFLSPHTLQLLSDMKRQFASLLKALNFVETDNPKHPHANLNSDNEKLIKAVICAGLYPNVAKIPKPDNGKISRHQLSAFTKDGERAEVHPGSVNARQGYFESPWLVYHEKMKSSATFLYDTTMVTPFSLLLFGGGLTSKEQHDGRCILAVDQWIEFWCSKSQSELIRELRRQLDNCLESKINSPGPTKWTVVSAESNMLRAIRELLTAEYVPPATE